MIIEKLAYEIKAGDTLAWSDATPEVVERVVEVGTGRKREIHVFVTGRDRPYSFVPQERTTVDQAR